jgi:hypothetical protein
MTWEWDAFSYPASSAFNTRAGRSDAAWGNLTLILTTVWPERQLTWGCPHDGMAWPGSSDTKCIGASMQPNTFQGENGGDGHADPTSETPLAMAAAVQVDSLPQLTLLVLGVSVLRTLPCGATAKGVMLFTVLPFLKCDTSVYRTCFFLQTTRPIHFDCSGVCQRQ